MFEKFMSAGWREFAQRYEGSFGFFKGKNGEKLLAKLTAIRQDACYFVDSRDISYTVYANSDDDIGFEFFPPKAQYYNTEENQVYLVQRVAQRQYQRGLTGKNTRIYTFGRLGLEAVPVDFTTLERIYLKPVAHKQAFATRKERRGVSLSGQLAWDRGYGFLYLYDKKIGTMCEADNTFGIQLDELDLWRTEVKDAMNSIGVKYEVN